MLHVIKISNDVDNVLKCHNEKSSNTFITIGNRDASADTEEGKSISGYLGKASYP
jgi:hypothetical protein